MENKNTDPLAESSAASQCQRPKDQIESEYKFDASFRNAGLRARVEQRIHNWKLEREKYRYDIAISLVGPTSSTLIQFTSRHKVRLLSLKRSPRNELSR